MRLQLRPKHEQRLGRQSKGNRAVQEGSEPPPGRWGNAQQPSVRATYGDTNTRDDGAEVRGPYKIINITKPLTNTFLIKGVQIVGAIEFPFQTTALSSL